MGAGKGGAERDGCGEQHGDELTGPDVVHGALPRSRSAGATAVIWAGALRADVL